MTGRLQDLVSAQAERTPDARAVVFADEALSYRELDLQSNRLAHMLMCSGCRKGDRVLLLLPKSIEAIVGLLGTLKAGCAYVPVDLESPAARVQRIVDAVEPKAALVGTEGYRR